MVKIGNILAKMRASPRNVRFEDLAKVCDFYFGRPRQRGTSHRIYRMPWAGDPRVNIQSHRGYAKPYQVRQVLAAITKFQEGPYE